MCSKNLPKSKTKDKLESVFLEAYPERDSKVQDETLMSDYETLFEPAQFLYRYQSLHQHSAIL